MTQDELLRLIDEAAADGRPTLDLSGKELSELPPEIGKLTRLKTLVLGRFQHEIMDFYNNLSTLPDELEQLTELESLFLDYNQFTELPEVIAKLSSLRSLDLAGNQLNSLPEGVSQLSNLTSLDLLGNQLSSLPKGIGQLSNLTWLDLTGNNFSSLPEVVGQLSNLIALGLRQNGLGSLPEAVGQLSNLTTLGLSFNQLSSLPEGISQLSNLTSLELSFNLFSSLPEAVGQISNLTSLELCYNQLSSLPEVVGQLSNLTSLDLRSNQFSSLPEVVGQLSSLTSLDLGSNQLNSLPEVVGQLSNLASLDLGGNNASGGNQLSSLPESIGQLSNLISLSLSDNQFSILPEGVSQLSNLTSLNLRGNDFSSLPEDVGQLSSLTSLSLRSNNFSSLPKGIGQLSNLTSLDLGYNQLSSLPEGISQLSNLTSLDLGYNQLSSLPEGISQLSNLTSLDLGYNQLSSLPEGISQLSNLTSLDLSYNQLSSLPEGVGQLSNLTSLNLRNNQLTGLSIWIQKLTHVQRVDLRRNPLPVPPEILGGKDIRNGHPNPLANVLKFYYQSQNKSASTPLCEAKLLILGEGEAGKTSLARKLVDPDYELNKKEKTTEGIEVIPYEFKQPDGQPCRINIWDFGGQEIYHATHQFFLSDRSVYILVVDARKENPNFYYWLKVIQLYGGDSPVLIIKNEKQDRPCSVNDRQLRSEFPNLEKSLETNLETNRNLDSIRATIERYISDLPHVGDRIPNPWANVRAVFENLTLTNNYISIQDYRQICCRYSITDPAEQNSLSQFLHDLGIFLHFQKNLQLKKTIFLKPEWSTDAVYKVLDAKQVRADCGRFCDQDIEKIWSDPQYSDMQGELLALMKAFEVCYEITGRVGYYIAPHLLEPNSPTYDIPWNPQDNLILTYRYTFKPKNIFPRLVVALHEYIEYQRMVWKHGVILSNGSARAELIEDDRYHKADIRIRISGTDKKQWLSVIGHHLDRINASFEKLEHEILFPCNCSECKGSQTPYEFPYKDLCRSLSKRNYTLKCLRSFEEVSVQTLINDVTDPRTYHEQTAVNTESSNQSPFSEKVVNVNIFPEQQYQESINVTVSGDAKDTQIIAGKNNTAAQTTEINQHGQGDNVAGNKIEGDSINTQVNYPQDLTQLSDTLTALLKDLSEEYNPNTARGQANIQHDALETIRQDPTLQQRLTNALKAGSEEALEQMIQHPLAKIIVKAIKGLIEG